MRETVDDGEQRGADREGAREPKAFGLSDGWVKVTLSSERAAGASSAAKRPCATRAPTRTSKLPAAPPTTDAAAKPTRQVTESATEQQQAAERQGVIRDHPLPAAVRRRAPRGRWWCSFFPLVADHGPIANWKPIGFHLGKQIGFLCASEGSFCVAAGR